MRFNTDKILKYIKRRLGFTAPKAEKVSNLESVDVILKKERGIERKASAARVAYVSGMPQRTGLSVKLISDRLAGNNSPVTDRTEQDRSLLKKIRAEVGAEYLPDTIYSRGEFRYFRERFSGHVDIEKTVGRLAQMYVDWLFFCKDRGYDMDDYFDYEFYRKSYFERLAFVSAAFRDNIRRNLNHKPLSLARKGVFLSSFGSFIKRPWLDCSTCTPDEFHDFCENNPVFFCKSESGYGAEGLRKLSPAPDQTDDLYISCREEKSIVEAPITQHDSISSFNPGTVNSIRVVTIADADDQIVIAGAAIRFGREGGFADNYHQGGLCAHVDPFDGRITGYAIDRTGKRYAAHPDSGLEFDGFLIPCWDKLRAEVSAAAESCMESNRFIGWDLAVTKDGEIDFIEGNSRPGFGILQSPNMKGLRSEYVSILSGLVTEEKLMDARRGYWRKWRLEI